MEYYKSKFNHKGVLFFKQKTQSSIKNKNAWVNDLNCLVFFSQGVSNSCNVLIAYLGKGSFVLNK